LVFLALLAGAAQAQTADETAADQTTTDQATADEATADDTTADDTAADETAADETTADEPASDDAVADEPASDTTTNEAVELKLGPAHVAGIVSFTLGTSINGDSVAVEALVPEGMGASPKAEVVAAAVANSDPTGSWQASGSGGTLTFRHLIGEAWEKVDLITNITDTTGSGTKLKSSDTAVAFTLTMDETAVAVGYDAMGDPSFITVSVTDTLAWTQALQGGETPQALLDTFQAFLAAEAGEGVEVVRDSASSLTLVLYYEESHVNWQVTDLGLEAGTKGEAVPLDDGASLIRRTR
jgi:hypothetical protein